MWNPEEFKAKIERADSLTLSQVKGMEKLIADSYVYMKALRKAMAHYTRELASEARRKLKIRARRRIRPLEEKKKEPKYKRIRPMPQNWKWK